MAQLVPKASPESGVPRIGEAAAVPPPDSEMARTKRPLAAWVVVSICTATAPALSPKTVTFLGSPPKAEMFFCTHCRAAIWSIRP